MRYLSRENGQTSVEAAFLFILMIAMMTSLVDFSQILDSYIGVVNAANVGAVYGSASFEAAGNLSVIRAAALSESTRLRCASPAVASNRALDPYGHYKVSVTVSCPLGGLFLFPSGLTLSASATQRVRDS
jgi:hypothetical protein